MRREQERVSDKTESSLERMNRVLLMRIGAECMAELRLQTWGPTHRRLLEFSFGGSYPCSNIVRPELGACVQAQG